MRKQYDFSKGVRGKFYHPNTHLKLPVYLEDDIAKKKSASSSAKPSRSAT